MRYKWTIRALPASTCLRRLRCTWSHRRQISWKARGLTVSVLSKRPQCDATRDNCCKATYKRDNCSAVKQRTNVITAIKQRTNNRAEYTLEHRRRQCSLVQYSAVHISRGQYSAAQCRGPVDVLFGCWNFPEVEHTIFFCHEKHQDRWPKQGAPHALAV